MVSALTSPAPLPAALEGQPDDEACIPGLRVEGDVAAVGLDDAPGDVQPETRALADFLGREERLGDSGLHLARYPRPIIGDLHRDVIPVIVRPDCYTPPTLHGVRCVVQKVDPYLVQLAGMGPDPRQPLLVVARHGGLLELVAEDGERTIEPLAHIGCPVGAAVHVGVLLDRLHELGDARRAPADFVSEAGSL